MAEITEPVLGLLVAGAQVDDDLQVLVLEQPGGAVLVDGLGLAVDEEVEDTFVLGL